MPTPTDTLLAERGKTHGDFGEHAQITQDLKDVMRLSAGWTRLSPAQREALEMNAHKIGRILAGDPNFADHWDDIAGYSRLVAQRLTTPETVQPNFGARVHETLSSALAAGVAVSLVGAGDDDGVTAIAAKFAPTAN